MGDSDKPIDETRTSGGGGQPVSDAPQVKRLGDFEVLGELGRGGMGIVYEARQISLRRRVALKVLPPSLGMGKNAVERFEREAHAAAKLHHTNIVPVYAIGEEDGSNYYAMELIEGAALDNVLRDLVEKHSNPLMEATVSRESDRARSAATGVATESTASTHSDSSTGGRSWFTTLAKLVGEVAEALDYAHGRGVIHRDIKPANLVLSEDGRLMITDFGLALIAQEPGMTVSGSFMGTPAFMSPEQIVAGRMKIDHRTDIYSLGASLYQMLTLERPFTGETREEVVAGIMTKEPRPPRRHNPRIPVDLETICLKAMEKDPDRRYQSAGEMASDLRQFLHGGLIAARRAGITRRTVKTVRRHPVAAVSIVAAVLLVSLGAFAWQALQRGSQEELGRILSEAKHALSQGSYDEALRKADQALAQDPSRVDARMIRARSLMNLWGRGNEAIAEAEAILAATPDDWAAHAILVAAAQSGFYGDDLEPHVAAVERLAPETAEAYALRASITDSPEEALELLNRALDIDPAHYEALVSRAWRQVSLKNFPAALDDADRLLVARPRSVNGRILRAACFFALHDLDTVKEELDRAREADPESPAVHLVLSEWHFQRGEIDEAEAEINTALELDPDNVAYLATRAEGLSGLSRYDESLRDVERLLQLDPRNPSYHHILVDIHLARGQNEEAREVLGRVEQMASEFSDPETVAWIHRIRSWKLRSMGQFEPALEAAEAAIAVEPDGFWGYTDRAAALRGLQGESAVVDDCRKAAELPSDSLGSLMSEADAFRGVCSMNDLALRNLDMVIERAPHWPDPYLRRSEILRTERRIDAAIADLVTATEIAPKWSEAWRQLGWVSWENGEFERSIEASRRAAELGHIWAHWQQALGLVALRRDDEAMAVAGEILRKVPDSWIGYERKAWIAYFTGRATEAAELVDRAIEADPERSSAPYILRAEFGRVSGTRGCDEVWADLEKALEMSPGNPSVAASVAAVAALIDCPEHYDGARCEELARKALDYDTTNASHHRSYGMVLRRNGRLQEALRAIETALELEPFARSPYNYQWLAMIHGALGNTREARDYYDRAAAVIDKFAPRNSGWNYVQDQAADSLD